LESSWKTRAIPADANPQLVAVSHHPLRLPEAAVQKSVDEVGERNNLGCIDPASGHGLGWASPDAGYRDHELPVCRTAP